MYLVGIKYNYIVIRLLTIFESKYSYNKYRQSSHGSHYLLVNKYIEPNKHNSSKLNIVSWFVILDAGLQSS